MIALQNTASQAALSLIERLREGLAASILAQAGQEPIRATASFGIAPLDPDASVELALERADEALYEAKTAGRNRTQLGPDRLISRRRLEPGATASYTDPDVFRDGAGLSGVTEQYGSVLAAAERGHVKLE